MRRNKDEGKDASWLKNEGEGKKINQNVCYIIYWE
jgi:hypothetical protein